MSRDKPCGFHFQNDGTMVLENYRDYDPATMLPENVAEAMISQAWCAEIERKAYLHSLEALCLTLGKGTSKRAD